MFLETTMLAEGETSTPSKPTLAGFVSWLESQDPCKSYDWSTYHDCPAGRYARSIGFWYMRDRDIDQFHADVKGLSALAHPGISNASRDTFGNCLARARVALEEQRSA